MTDITECLICGQKFTGPRIEIIGKPGARLQELLTSLSQHLHGKHPEHGRAMELRGGEFMGLLFMMNFKTTDQELTKKQDEFRWQIHQQTLNARIPDEKLKESCMRLAKKLIAIERIMADRNNRVVINAELETAFANELIDVFTGIRDELQEPNRYPVATAVLT